MMYTMKTQGLQVRVQSTYDKQVRIHVGAYDAAGIGTLNLSPHRAVLLGNALLAAAAEARAINDHDARLPNLEQIRECVRENV